MGVYEQVKWQTHTIVYCVFSIPDLVPVIS